MIYCISGIRGEYDLFMSLMEKINFSESDKLIVCGDFISRSASSVKLMKHLFNMPNCICIKGHNEYDFFRFYRTRMHSAIMDYDAILWHLQQYFPIDGAELDWKTVNTLVELPYYVDFDEFICTHSGMPLADPDEVIWEDVLQGDFDEYAPSVCEGKCVLFSHASVKEGDDDRSIVKYPSEGGKSIADHYKIKLDTNVHASGVLGCFRADDCASFYVSKQ